MAVTDSRSCKFWALGCLYWLKGLGFRAIRGLKFRSIRGLGFRVKGLGFRAIRGFEV